MAFDYIFGSILAKLTPFYKKNRNNDLVVVTIHGAMQQITLTKYFDFKSIHLLLWF